MKAFGIFMAGLLAAAGGIAAAAYIAKKKLDKENEEDYFDGWDDGFDDDWDLDFDEDEENDEAKPADGAATSVKSVIAEEKGDVFEESPEDDSDEEL